MTPEIALINAIRIRLKNDPVLAPMVGQNVFDQIPSGISPPYVYIGPAGRRRVVLDCYEAWAQRIRLYVIYTSWNRTQVWEAAEAVIQSLDLQELYLEAPFVLQEPLKITDTGDVIDPNAPKSVFIDITTTIARYDLTAQSDQHLIGVGQIATASH